MNKACKVYLFFETIFWVCVALEVALLVGILDTVTQEIAVYMIRVIALTIFTAYLFRFLRSLSKNVHDRLIASREIEERTDLPLVEEKEVIQQRSCRAFYNCKHKAGGFTVAEREV